MLSFFRKIRLRLLGKTSPDNVHSSLKSKSLISKYLLYAIGEVALVVVGILIALQINNWNEGRKEQLAKKEYIGNILEDLAADTLNIDELMAWSELGIKQIEAYFNYFETVHQFTPILTLLDSALESSYCCNRYFPVNNTFLEMQSSGTFKLLSETERDALIDLNHEQEFTQIVIEKTISVWLEKGLKIDEYIPSREAPLFRAGELSFFQGNHTVTEKDLYKGLFHIHQQLDTNLALLRVFVYYCPRLKAKTKEIIASLKEGE